MTKLDGVFLLNSLLEAGFPSNVATVILHYVSSSVMHIQWNRKISSPFFPSQSFRKEDPLSSYLFVICLERLSHSIFDVLDWNLWKLIKLSKNGSGLSHLLFADDLVLFAEVSVQ